ncbi:hypothetical protein [Bacillus sp. ME78]|uniref:hypothetical protein n=1 Tax=Bacillus sp. ME78 TaxID=2744261 RepID=UPI0021750FD2|nr:hypothetical protein [Bacillus sp. ME78]
MKNKFTRIIMLIVVMALSVTALAANSTIQVLYQNEQFDLANEYNTTTSKFIPKKDGVYNIIGSVHFQPTIQTTPYQITVSIAVNGVSIGPDKEVHGAVNVVGITRGIILWKQLIS